MKVQVQINPNLRINFLIRQGQISRVHAFAPCPMRASDRHEEHPDRVVIKEQVKAYLGEACPNKITLTGPNSDGQIQSIAEDLPAYARRYALVGDVVYHVIDAYRQAFFEEHPQAWVIDGNAARARAGRTGVPVIRWKPEAVQDGI